MYFVFGVLRAWPHDLDGMLRAVEAGPEKVGHAGVDLEELVAGAAGVQDVNDGSDERGRIGYEVGTGLDFEIEFAAVLPGEGTKGLNHGQADLAQVDGGLSGHPADLVSAAEVENSDIGQTGAGVQRHEGNALPELGVAAGANMSVESCELQAVSASGSQSLRKILVPDAEAGGRSADVGAVVVAGAEAGIDPDRKLAAREESAERVDLSDRAGIKEDALVNEGFKVVRKFLGSELDMTRRDADAQRALGFVAAAGVNMQTGIGEDLEDRPRRAGLHGVTGGQAEGIGKSRTRLAWRSSVP